MNIYNVHWLNKGIIQAGGVFFFHLVIHAFVHYFISFCLSCHLFLSWPSFLFVLSVFCLFQLSIKFHLISLESDWCVFSVVLLHLFPCNIPVLLVILLIHFSYVTFILIYFPSWLLFSLHSRYPCDIFLFVTRTFIYQYIALFLPPLHSSFHLSLSI